MRKSILGLSAFALAALATTPAMADDAPAATPEFTVNGSATLTSDYRFRGISQTDRDPAIQGSITVTHSSGFYVSFWSSSVHNYVTDKGSATQELDLIGGYHHTLSNGVTLDGGLLYYVYPGRNDGTFKSDFFEPYADVAYTYGPVTGKVTVNYAWKQKALSPTQYYLEQKQDNLYLAGDLSATVPGTKFGLSAHLGHTWGPSWIGTTNYADGTARKQYFDWNIGANYTWKNLTLGVSYVDTNTHFGPLDNDEAKAAAVVSLTAAF